MDSIDISSFTSPKRKRFPPAVSTIPPTPPTSSPPPDVRFSTNVPQLAVNDNEEAPGSPRSKVAYHFQGLQLEERPEVTKFILDMPKRSRPVFDEPMDEDQPQNEDGVVRKRVKLAKERKDPRIEIPETPDLRKTDPSKSFPVVIAPLEGQSAQTMASRAEGQELRNLVDPVIFKGNQVTKLKGIGDLKRAYPSINRLADSKSRSKKRLGTPPLGSLAPALGNVGEQLGIVDSERAALTWHDDEITGHNPDDPDDDGEGINGIGFKPTSAEAYARSQKRRQQMAEYKNREAKEARRSRIEKRRNSDREAVGKEAEKSRKVRFMEENADKVMLI